MPDTPTNTPQGNPAAAPAQGASNVPAVQSPATQKFALPTELAGKSAEEVGQYYSDRYKDYDSYKERAGKYDGYADLKLTPEQIKNNIEWTQQVSGNLTRGLHAVYDPKTNQIQWVDGKGQAKTAPAQAEPQDWRGADWDLQDETARSDRMAGHIWKDLLTPEISRVVDTYNQQFAEALRQQEAQFAFFMDAVEQWQQNPTKLKLRDIIAKANEVTHRQPADALRMAAADLLSPDQQRMEIENQVAARMAEFQTKWENEHKSPAMLPAPMGGSHRVSTGDKPRTLADARAAMMRRIQSA
jgi:hypothetical protein